ncbi:hypothetical protein EZH22_04245 [Xanthobacter dioxanivorans]|uniref:Uncharacterized protein n=1 Tax=Xanthobacter dioxanivorans TaxID=2528964 RepID=A0A974SJV1_9HYPH|nr:hypothetical protein [Xanthobacter dioxanivorans]QRG07614.1 hypothetical protein EZH22_04245 [Xanthobacter dioxanivorans]
MDDFAKRNLFSTPETFRPFPDNPGGVSGRILADFGAPIDVCNKLPKAAPTFAFTLGTTSE